MAVVQSEGSLTALNPMPDFRPVTSVRLDDDYSEDYAALWRKNPQVRTVISFLARNVAQISLPVYERISNTERSRAPDDHPLVKLIRRPNPRTTRYRLMDSLINDRGIWDTGLWWKIRQGKQVTGLVRLPPAMVRPVGSTWLWPEAYELKGSRGSKKFAPEDVVHFRGYNPEDSRWGVSPLETLRRILAEDYQAGKARERLNRNGAQFAGVIERPVDAPEWDDPAAKQFARDFHSAWSSQGSSAGGTPILEDGMKYVANGVTPKDLQYIEARKLTREEIAAAFHIPLPMVQLLEHATFSNIKEQHQQLYQDTLGPMLQEIQEDIELQLIRDFDPSGRLYVEFNLADKMKGSLAEQAAGYQTATGRPWLTVNEVRQMENRPPIDGGDELIVPMNVTVGGQASPTDSAPKTSGEVVRKFVGRQAATVLTALGAKSAGWWDESRWNTELATDLAAVGVTNAEAAAKAVNLRTKQRLDEAIAAGEAPAAVFSTIA